MDEADITIENHVATFELNQTAPFGGSYQGQFRFRTQLTPMQEIQADRDYRTMVGEYGKDASVKILNLAYILAQLKQRIIEAPPFWQDGSGFGGASVRDHEILETVFQVAMKAEEKYRKIVTEKQLKSVERLKASLERKKEEQDLDEGLK